MNDVGENVMHSELPPQARIWHVANALDRRAAIFPKLLISTLCWIAMFLQQVEACSPGTLRRAPTASQGRKIAVSESFKPGESVNFTTISYDLLSRTTRTTRPGNISDFVMLQGSLMLNGQPATYSKAKNANGQILERWEDQHGRLVRSLDPSGQTTVFSHDVEGRLLTVAIAGQTLLTNTWDNFGNKVAVSEVNSGASSSIYNGFGEVVSSTNAKGQVTAFTYDSLGRPLTIAKPEGTYTTSYSNTSGITLGKPLAITGSLGAAGYQETFSYDSLGRPAGTTKSQFGEAFTTSTTYDALGRVSSSTDAGGLTVFNEYDPTFSFPLKRKLAPGSYEGAGTVLWQAGTYDSKGRTLTQTLAHGVTTASAYHPAKGDLTALSSSWSGGALQNKGYVWDDMGNLTSRTDHLAGRLETFGYDFLNRLASSSVTRLDTEDTTPVPTAQSYTYSTNGNLLTKGSSATLTYNDPTRPHAVTSAIVKGFNRSYAYDAAGYVVSDSKRSYAWTSFGQLRQLDYLAAPDLKDFSGNLVHPTATVTSAFDFDSGGNRARQTKERIALDDSRTIEYTLYLGSYEREFHQTKADGGAPAVLAKTVHRHSLGGGVIYTRTLGGPDPGVKLMNVLADHLGSTDVILTGKWNGSAFANHTTERQSFDAWGERRAADTQVNFRATDGDAFHTGAQDYDRGYTGHEQLDDSGLIHMNGRIYDPELGRFLSPDPYVQIPEYSQNFNRYSYVLNNPLNATDPSGFSFLSKVFGKIGSFIKENWRTIVVMVVMAVVTAGVGNAFIAAGSSIFTTVNAAGATVLSAAGMAATGAIAGAVGGAVGSALAGGDLGDVLRGAAVGGIQGAISGGILHGLNDGLGFDNMFLHIAGHGVVGGGANEAMGGKFQDGFLSAAAGAASTYIPFANGSRLSRTLKASVAGGTANVLGGGKFANGAFTAAFQHLLNAEGGLGGGIKSIAGASSKALKVLGTFLIGENYGAAWLDLIGAKNSAVGEASGLISRMNNSGFDTQINDNKFGHAVQTSLIQRKLGIIGAPLVSLVGVLYELQHVFYPGHVQGQGGAGGYTRTAPFYGVTDGQHPINWAWDTVGDLVGNTLGQATGIFGFDAYNSNRVALAIPGPNYSGSRSARLGNPSGFWTKLAPPGAAWPY